MTWTYKTEGNNSCNQAHTYVPAGDGVTSGSDNISHPRTETKPFEHAATVSLNPGVSSPVVSGERCLLGAIRHLWLLQSFHLLLCMRSLSLIYTKKSSKNHVLNINL